MTITFHLKRTQQEAREEVVVREGSQQINVSFGQESSDLQASTQAAQKAATQVAKIAEQTAEIAREVSTEKTSEPLVRNQQLFVLLVIVTLSAVLLLGWMVFQAGHASASTSETQIFYRRMIEGMVLTMVVVAIVILGITEKITEEGLATVLAAIVGYAVGRSAGG